MTSPVEVISFHDIADIYGLREVQRAIRTQYDIIDRNRGPLSDYDIETSSYYPDLASYRSDIHASLDGDIPTSVDRNDIHADFRIIKVGSMVVGGLDVMTPVGPIALPNMRTIGYYLDVDRGFTGKGYATEAARFVIEDLMEDLDIDTIDAYTHPMNEKSQAVLLRSGLNLARSQPYANMRRFEITRRMFNDLGVTQA